MDGTAAMPARRHAIAVLASDPAPENLPVLLSQLETAELAPEVIPLLGRFNDAETIRFGTASVDST